MKYLVLRKISLPVDDPFLEMTGLEAVTPSGLPFDGRAEEMPEKDAADLRRDPQVDDVIPSIPFSLVQPMDGPAAAAAGTAWGLDAIGAVASPQTGVGVTVAVLDTGIDTAHPAFAGMTFDHQDLMDFSANDQGVSGAAPDQNGHGTHVAGTIFGRDVAGTRVGVARGVTKVLIGKVLGPNGGPTEAVYNAINWALTRRADVISMSLGIDFPRVVERFVQEGFPPGLAAARALEGYRANLRLLDRLADTVRELVGRGRGAVIVAAAGNESRRAADPRFVVPAAPPAAATGFISVGAVGKMAGGFTVAPFSNTGCVLAGPGVDILSAQLGGGLTEKSGTSMATPHVAGAAALWVQKLFPTSRPAGWAKDVQRKLEGTTADLPGLARVDVGLGLVQCPK